MTFSGKNTNAKEEDKDGNDKTKEKKNETEPKEEADATAPLNESSGAKGKAMLTIFYGRRIPTEVFSLRRRKKKSTHWLLSGNSVYFQEILTIF